MKIKHLSLAVLALALLFAGCGKEKADESVNTKNMAQIQAESGVPVNTRTLDTGTFSYFLTFDANVSGISESVATAKISDRIEEVLFSVGDIVQEGDIVITFPKDNLDANYYQLKASYENAKTTFERMSSLYAANGISKQNYDNSKTQYELAAANWENANDRLNITAPIGGIITKINARATSRVESGDELFAVSDLSKLKCKVWIQEKDISKVHLGDKARATWEGKTIPGSIIQLDLALNSDSQAFGAWIEFDNAENTIPSGVNAKVQIVTYEKPGAIVIHRKDISYSSDAPYAFVAEGDRAVKRELTLGMNYKDDVEVTGGLYPGDVLITDGNKNVKDGTLIRVINEEQY